MRLAKIKTANGSSYVSVAMQDGQWMVTGAAEAPAWDPQPETAGQLTGPLTSFELLAPVRPSKIVCVGRNYRAHAAEMGSDVPAYPLLFLKPPSSLLAPNGVVRMPAISERVDFEGELAIVIGRQCRQLTAADDAANFIFGYTLVNDVTARDLQKQDGQWTRAKGFDTFCPAGPLLVTPDNDFNPLKASVALTTKVNGETRQNGNTADLLFAIPELLRFITSFMTLEPGDLIPTGTPAGVGPLKPGDVVEVSVAGMGTLRNSFANA